MKPATPRLSFLNDFFTMQLMKKMLSIAILLSGLLLAGCASPPSTHPAAVYDLGALPGGASAQPTLPGLPALSLAEISAPAWLDNTGMVYRLTYANGQQPRPYADSHWNMPPAQLLEQRLKSRLTAAGGMLANASDNALNLPLLRIELDDFSQQFETPAASTVSVRARATVFDRRALLAQKSFERQLPAPSADAAGAARALAQASELLIGDLMQWLTQLPLKK